MLKNYVYKIGEVWFNFFFFFVLKVDIIVIVVKLNVTFICFFYFLLQIFYYFLCVKYNYYYYYYYSLLLFFFIFHMSLISKGITQLEKNFSFHIHDGNYYDKILNKSLWEKFTDVFGKNPLIWILPIGINLQLIIYFLLN